MGAAHPTRGHRRDGKGERVMEGFEKAVMDAAQKAFLKIVSDGSWIQPDYNNRIKLPPSIMNEVWGLVDTERLKKALAKRIESELADRIVNHIATELATDIKQILSVKERREALRHLAREHMEAIMKIPAEVSP